MAIPNGITRQHVQQAIQKLNAGIEHPFSDSVGYDLHFEGRTYPPNAVVALAANVAPWTDLGPSDFSGVESPGAANRVLESLGFDMRPKTPVSKQESAVWLEWSHDERMPETAFAERASRAIAVSIPLKINLCSGSMPYQ